MNYTIEHTKLGDEEILAYIQTESWKVAFKDILSADILQECTRMDKVTAMYRRLLEQNIGNGYLLKIDGNPHCIAWWDTAREKDMPGYDKVMLWVFEDNARARGCYEAHGFETQGKIKPGLEPKEICYEKKL